jgi:Fe2+ or Zn2+ uptake regulation protein
MEKIIVENGMDKCTAVLKKCGLKMTAPRLEIMQYLNKHHDHPTAAKIYSELKKKNPSLSRTTVYNTLETLAKHSVLQVIFITENEMRYDCNTQMHHHFVCKACGTIMDINVKCKFLDEMLNGEHEVQEVHGYFKGICAYCNGKKGKRTS